MDHKNPKRSVSQKFIPIKLTHKWEIENFLDYFHKNCIHKELTSEIFFPHSNHDIRFYLLLRINPNENGDGHNLAVFIKMATLEQVTVDFKLSILNENGDKREQKKKFNLLVQEDADVGFPEFIQMGKLNSEKAFLDNEILKFLFELTIIESVDNVNSENLAIDQFTKPWAFMSIYDVSSYSESRTQLPVYEFSEKLTFDLGQEIINGFIEPAQVLNNIFTGRLYLNGKNGHQRDPELYIDLFLETKLEIEIFFRNQNRENFYEHITIHNSGEHLVRKIGFNSIQTANGQLPRKLVFFIKTGKTFGTPITTGEREPEVSLAEENESLAELNYPTDVILVFNDGTKLFCHRIILVNRSKKFKEFFDKLDKKDVYKIRVSDMDVETGEELLWLIYTGRIRPGQIPELLFTTFKYDYNMFEEAIEDMKFHSSKEKQFEILLNLLIKAVIHKATRLMLNVLNHLEKSDLIDELTKATNVSFKTRDGRLLHCHEDLVAEICKVLNSWFNFKSEVQKQKETVCSDERSLDRIERSKTDDKNFIVPYATSDALALILEFIYCRRCKLTFVVPKNSAKFLCFADFFCMFDLKDKLIGNLCSQINYETFLKINRLARYDNSAKMLTSKLDEFVGGNPEVLSNVNKFLTVRVSPESELNNVSGVDTPEIHTGILTENKRDFVDNSKLLNVDSNNESNKELLVAADQCQVNSLKFLCEQHLLKRINTFSSVELLLRANEAKSEILESKAADYIRRNSSQIIVIDHFQILYEDRPDLIEEHNLDSFYDKIASLQEMV